MHQKRQHMQLQLAGCAHDPFQESLVMFGRSSDVAEHGIQEPRYVAPRARIY